MSQRTAIHDRIDGSLAAIGALRDQADRIRDLTLAVHGRLRSGGTLYTAGNGGSAAQALHLAEELIGRYRGDRPPLRAMCLNADPTAITCIANDYGYAQVFSRQCEALLAEGDALLVLSTSGNSENVVAALEVARQRHTLTAGLLGGGGGRCAALCDHAVTLAERDSAHVQEAHQVAVHLICELIESETA
ncbi:MAG: D-sedoheptulose-7-phosphate isomerase [Planctomycetota bacterium]|jgi:D-sedoheptulose 7-phosphate isomerase